MAILRKSDGTVAIDPSSGEFQSWVALPETVDLVIPQEILKLLYHFSIVPQVSDLLQDLFQQRIGYLRGRGLKRTCRRLFDPTTVPVVLGSTVARRPR